MRRLVALVIATSAMLAASIAAADTKVPFALSVNAPTGWGMIDAFPRAYAATAQVGLAKHHGLRLNVASYEWGTLAEVGFEGETDYDGDVVDVAIGHQWFSRGLWNGLSFDSDLLVRRSDRRVDRSGWGGRVFGTRSSTIAGRLMVGWTWAVGEHAFVSLASGFSYGVEIAQDDRYRVDDETSAVMLVTETDVIRDALTFETMLRFGGAFR